jgi:ATP-dependent RNA helicase DHX57
MVSPYSLLLFGGVIEVHHRNSLIGVGTGGWIRFHAEARVGVLVKGLRAALNRLLSDKIAQPALELRDEPVVEAILRLLMDNLM